MVPFGASVIAPFMATLAGHLGVFWSSFPLEFSRNNLDEKGFSNEGVIE